MFAHYYGSKARGFVLIISDSPAINGDHVKLTLPVAGKAEARRLATGYNAKPWNF